MRVSTPFVPAVDITQTLMTTRPLTLESVMVHNTAQLRPAHHGQIPPTTKLNTIRGGVEQHRHGNIQKYPARLSGGWQADDGSHEEH